MNASLLQSLADCPGPFAPGDFVSAVSDGAGGVDFVGAAVNLGTITGPMTFDFPPSGPAGGDTELIFVDTPPANPSKSLVQFGGALASGSPNGTYLGGVQPSTYTGSLFDFWGGATPERKFQVTWDGRIGIGGYDMFGGIGPFCSIAIKGKPGTVVGDPQTANVFMESNHLVNTSGFIIQTSTSNQFLALAFQPVNAQNTNLNSVPLSGRLSVGTLMTGGLILMTSAVGAPITFATGSSAFAHRRWQIDGNGHLVPFGSTYNIGDVTNRAATIYGVAGDFTGNITLADGSSFQPAPGGSNTPILRLNATSAGIWGHRLAYAGTDVAALDANASGEVRVGGIAVGSGYSLGFYTEGNRDWEVLNGGTLRGYHRRISDGYTQLSSAGGAAHNAYFACRSEFDQTGIHYDVHRAANIASVTGFSTGAHLFSTGFTCTSGSLVSFYNGTEWRGSILSRGGLTLRNDTPNTGDMLILQRGDGEIRTRVDSQGRLLLTGPYGSVGQVNITPAVDADPASIYLNGGTAGSQLLMGSNYGLWYQYTSAATNGEMTWYTAGAERFSFASDSRFKIRENAATFTDFNPKVGDSGSSIAYLFDTAVGLSLGYIARFRSGGADKLELHSISNNTKLDVVGSGAGVWGYRIKYGTSVKAVYDANAGTGEIRIGEAPPEVGGPGGYFLGFYTDGTKKMDLLPTGELRNYAFRISDGFTSLTSAGSGQHSGYLYSRSESTTYGMYYDAHKAANIAAATGFSYAAHVFNTGFTATSGNLFQLWNNTEFRFQVAARGGFTFRNDGLDTGDVLTIEDWGGTNLATMSKTGGLLLGAGTINAAALLELDSTTRGLLNARMTTTQRDAITSPPDGLLVYNATVGKLQGRHAGVWEDLGGGAAPSSFVDEMIFRDDAGTPHYWKLRVNSLGYVVTEDLGTTPP